MRRPQDWSRQAQHDLAAAGDARAAGHFEWACFMAQQAAEHAVKALHHQAGTEAWGHSVTALLQDLGEVPAEILDTGKALDKHYIPARYPDAHPEGAPGDLYTAEEAERALEQAKQVLDYVRDHLSQT